MRFSNEIFNNFIYKGFYELFIISLFYNGNYFLDVGHIWDRINFMYEKRGFNLFEIVFVTVGDGFERKKYLGLNFLKYL